MRHHHHTSEDEIFNKNYHTSTMWHVTEKKIKTYVTKNMQHVWECTHVVAAVELTVAASLNMDPVFSTMCERSSACPYNLRCVWLPWVCPGCWRGLMGYGGCCGGCGWWSCDGGGGGCWCCRCRSGSWPSVLVEPSADWDSCPDKSRISAGCESKTPVSAGLGQGNRIILKI